MAIIDMTTMRYINLLDKVTHVRTSICFTHNNTIFFAVDKRDMSKAIGPSANNIKTMQEKMGRKVRIIRKAEGIEDAKKFIEDIISPVKMKSLEIKEKSLIITAGNNQNKASLIGRNKRRYEELKKIVQDYFSLELKIV